MNNKVDIIDFMRESIKYTISIFNENQDRELPYGSIIKKDEPFLYTAIRGDDEGEINDEVLNFIDFMKFPMPNLDENILYEDLKKHLSMIQKNTQNCYEFYSKGIDAKYKIKIANFRLLD